MESAEKFLDSCYYLQPRLPTSKGGRQLLTYADIKNYVVDEQDGQETGRTTRCVKTRKALDISLTGKFVQRLNGTRCISSTKVELDRRRRPQEHVKLPLPQKPIDTCSYKLPASLPYKVMEKPTSQSARFEHVRSRQSRKGSECMLPYRLTVSQPTAPSTSNGKDSSPTDQPTPRLSYTTFYNGINIRPAQRQTIASSSIKVESTRKRQLQQLVEILGETTLTPYLHKLTVGQSTATQPMVNTDAIDYSVIFGSRI